MSFLSYTTKKAAFKLPSFEITETISIYIYQLTFWWEKVQSMQY